MKDRIRWRKWGGTACLFVLLLMNCSCSDFLRPTDGGQSVMTKETERVEAVSSAEAVETEDTNEKEIYVHVCGCVKNPGLYTFPVGVRAGNAVESAGGFTKKADRSAVNLAAVLEDGMQLYVPSRKEEESGQGIVSEEESVNINTAGIEELMTLSGIGESRAEAILSFREENGTFSTIEDIKNVSGIGEGIFERIKNRITV